MNKEAHIKKIDCTRDYFNRLWTALIATIAGTIAVLVSPDTGYRIFLLTAGTFASIIFIHNCLINSRVLNKFLKELKEEK